MPSSSSVRPSFVMGGNSGDAYHNSLEQFIGFVEFVGFVGLKRQSAVDSRVQKR